jgi:hypothetical protein
MVARLCYMVRLNSGNRMIRYRADMIYEYLNKDKEKCNSTKRTNADRIECIDMKRDKYSQRFRSIKSRGSSSLLI